MVAQGAGLLTLVEHPLEPCLVEVEEPDHCVLHGGRQRLVLGGQHAAQAHPLLTQHVEVDSGVRRDLRRCVARSVVDLVERGLESGRVPVDQRPAKLCLAGEVVVEGRLGNAEFGSDIGVADAVETTYLHQSLGDVERSLCRVGNGALASFHKSLSYLTKPLDVLTY